MTHILMINGSYRDDGITDQTLDAMREQLQSAGAEVDEIRLRDYPIEFCLNCRECTQQPGEAPGQCVHDDGMAQLIRQIEQADGLVLASPTNAGAVTAVFKRFIERLIPFAYWPWGQPAPRLRHKPSRAKPAVLVSSSAAPAVLGRLIFDTLKQLRQAANMVGARPVARVFSGLVSDTPHKQISTKTRARVQAAASRLLNN